jgi:hypothetical protein
MHAEFARFLAGNALPCAPCPPSPKLLVGAVTGPIDWRDLSDGVVNCCRLECRMVKTVGSRWLAVCWFAPLLSSRAGLRQRKSLCAIPKGTPICFIVVKTLEGNALADGDMTQVSHGDRVSAQVTIHFKDGSIHDETAVFSGRHNFRLLNYHLVQKGSAFPHPIELSIVYRPSHGSLHGQV